MRITEYTNINTRPESVLINNDTCKIRHESIAHKNKFNAKRIFAFDFEVLTKNGITYPVILGKSQVKGKTNEVVRGYPKSIDFDHDNFDNMEVLEQVIYFLTNTENSEGGSYQDRKSLKFFQNLKYDFSIIVRLLPSFNSNELRSIDETIITLGSKDYKISVLGNISFSIEVIGVKRAKFTYFDLYRLTNASLEKASKLYGVGTKGLDLIDCLPVIQQIDDTVNSNSNLTEIVFNNHKIYDAVKYSAIKYCESDCSLTAKIAFNVRKSAQELGIPFNNPYTNASLAKEYIKQNIEYPKLMPIYTNDHYREEYENEGKTELLEWLDKTTELWTDFNNLAIQSYYGGRFEFIKRGRIKNVYGLDYASMYPSIQRNLPNTDNFDLYRLNPNKIESNIRSAEGGYINAKVWISENAVICPIPMKTRIKTDSSHSYKITFPILRGQEVTLSLEMYKFLTEGSYPHLEKIEITGGILFTIRKVKNDTIFNRRKPRSKIDKPFSYITDLYAERNELIKKYGKGNPRELTTKLIMNSSYGITAEKNPNTEIVDKGIFGKIKQTNPDKPMKAGRFNRPYYANMITDLGRLMILKDIFDFGLEKNVIGIATDCIYLDKQGYEILSNTDRVSDSEKKLGYLETDYHGDMIAIGNGMYQIIDSKTGKMKMVTRGFSDRGFPNFFELDEKQKKQQKILVENRRPRSWKECLSSNTLTIENIGLFEDVSKYVDVAMDKSRIWDGVITNVGDLQNITENSKPIILQEE